MDILHRLLIDHARQRGLIQRILDNAADDRERAVLFEELRAELMAHAAAEEQVLYAAMFSDRQAQIQRSVDCNDKIAELAFQLHDLAVDNPEWLETFTRLTEEVEHHLRVEETELFPYARRTMKPDKAKRLGRNFEKLKLQELRLECDCPVEQCPTLVQERAMSCVPLKERRKPGRASLLLAVGRGLRRRLSNRGLVRQKSG